MVSSETKFSEFKPVLFHFVKCLGASFDVRFFLETVVSIFCYKHHSHPIVSRILLFCSKSFIVRTTLFFHWLLPPRQFFLKCAGSIRTFSCLEELIFYFTRKIFFLEKIVPFTCGFSLRSQTTQYSRHRKRIYFILFKINVLLKERVEFFWGCCFFCAFLQ